MAVDMIASIPVARRLQGFDYAIRNGKMSMEDKFYYLVQGTAHGLIGLDRLRTLAGEEGGVLNIFAFIDYFYQKNNTLPEIKALAKRLEETPDPGNALYCKSGLKTRLPLPIPSYLLPSSPSMTTNCLPC